jgi:hypothetical protein
MKKKQSIERRNESPDEPADAAADEAAKAKAEELRAALLSKSEQGQSSLGSLPARQGHKSRKRSK